MDGDRIFPGNSEDRIFPFTTPPDEALDFVFMKIVRHVIKVVSEKIIALEISKKFLIKIPTDFRMVIHKQHQALYGKKFIYLNKKLLKKIFSQLNFLRNLCVFPNGHVQILREGKMENFFLSQCFDCVPFLHSTVEKWMQEKLQEISNDSMNHGENSPFIKKEKVL